MVFVIHWHESAMDIHIFPILIPPPPSHLPVHPIPLGLPSAPGPSTCLMHPTWAGWLSSVWTNNQHSLCYILELEVTQSRAWLSWIGVWVGLSSPDPGGLFGSAPTRIPWGYSLRCWVELLIYHLNSWWAGARVLLCVICVSMHLVSGTLIRVVTTVLI